MGDKELEVRIEPSSDDPDERDWARQVRSLYDELEDKAGSVRQQVKPEAGKKGGAVEIIVALGTSGAIAAALQAFKLWLARDRNRSVKRTMKVDGKETALELSTHSMSEEAVRATLQKAFEHVQRS